MNLQERATPMDAMQIVSEAGMTEDPGYYSGRGAIRSDLNNQILEKVYQGIKKEYGEEPAQNFVQMVADIPKLSATDFLLTLYRLEGNNWEWDKMLSNKKGIYLGNDGSVFGTMASALCGMRGIDETHTIRSQFLTRHGE